MPTRFTALLIATLLLAGCAPQLAELQQPPKRLTQYGYSFMPLDEPGWKIAERNGQKVILGRKGSSRDETVVIMAGNTPIPPLNSAAEFEAFMRKHLLREEEPSVRFKAEKNEMEMVKQAGADCARTHTVSIDRMAKKRSGGDGDMILEMLQLICRHPDNAGTATFLGYSQRYFPGYRDPQLSEKAERLFRSLHFSKF